MITLEKLQSLRDIITLLAVCYIIITLIITIKIAIDLNKQQALDTDPKAIQKISFTGRLNRGEM